jgi:CRISPR-associated protein Cas1
MQYQAYLDTKKRYAIAEQIVSQKIAHSHNLLKELSRFYGEVTLKEVERVFAAEKGNFAAGPHTVTNLMNYEGRIATFYWSMLVKVFNRLHPDFHFVKRGTKSYSWNTNAADEVNALLNYGYAILESEIRKDVNAIGLDPTVGFLHELAQPKTPLVYDLQELFRWLVDLSVLQLLEEKKLKKSDFIVTENLHIRLRPATAKMLIEKISLNFNRTGPHTGKKYTYQNILVENVRSLANFILGKHKTCSMVIPFATVLRNDSLVLQCKILSMTPAERKRLGINKSTLWYQRQNLAKRKSSRLYGKVLTKLT